MIFAVLGLHNNELEPSAGVILQALKDNSKLTFINLNDNSMTGQAAEHLAYITLVIFSIMIRK